MNHYTLESAPILPVIITVPVFAMKILKSADDRSDNRKLIVVQNFHCFGAKHSGFMRVFIETQSKHLKTLSFSLISESAHTNFLLLFLSNFSCADYHLVHIYLEGHTDLATEELIAQEVNHLGYGFANSHDTGAS